MTAPSATLRLRVTAVHELNPLIRMLRLRADDGRALPGFAAGAHIRVQVSLPDGKTDWRHYSLINFAAERNATNAPAEYVIAVRKETEGRGGSRFMHEQLKEGDSIAIEAPKNDFPLHAGPGGTVLVAGGIGVTPLASMAARRRAEGACFGAGDAPDGHEGGNDEAVDLDVHCVQGPSADACCEGPALFRSQVRDPCGLNHLLFLQRFSYGVRDAVHARQGQVF